MPISTITLKGQITIPKEIRDEMGLKAGDRVNVFKDKTGQLAVRVITSDFRSLRGILKSRRTRPLSQKEMDDAIARGACGK